MNFFLCRSFDNSYAFTNFCPYRLRDNDILRGFWYYYPYWLGGGPFMVYGSLSDFNGLDKESVEKGTIKNLVTGQVIIYADLLTMEDHDKKIYYDFGV